MRYYIPVHRSYDSEEIEALISVSEFKHLDQKLLFIIPDTFIRCFIHANKLIFSRDLIGNRKEDGITFYDTGLKTDVLEKPEPFIINIKRGNNAEK